MVKNYMNQARMSTLRDWLSELTSRRQTLAMLKRHGLEQHQRSCSYFVRGRTKQLTLEMFTKLWDAYVAENKSKRVA